MLDRHKLIVGSSLVALLLLLVAAWRWQTAASAGEVPHRATVTLDLYSGLPNPEWALTTEEIATLMPLMTEGASSAMTRPVTPGLGYRGFIVVTTDAAGGHRYFRLFHGTITEEGVVVRRTNDPTQRAEALLFQSLCDHHPNECSDQLRSLIALPDAP